MAENYFNDWKVAGDSLEDTSQVWLGAVSLTEEVKETAMRIFPCKKERIFDRKASQGMRRLPHPCLVTLD